MRTAHELRDSSVSVCVATIETAGCPVSARAFGPGALMTLTEGGVATQPVYSTVITIAPTGSA